MRDYIRLMKRRNFLKSMAAAAVAPVIPLPALSMGKAAIASPIVPSGTYIWAETIVRAHNNCSLAMLQRHLRIDASAAAALKSQLIRNGVISANANAYGMHKAVKPLLDSAFLKPIQPETGLKQSLVQSNDRANGDRIETLDYGESADPDEPAVQQDFHVQAWYAYQDQKSQDRSS